MIRLRKIEVEEDIQFLYELLKERSVEINIFHKKLPSYDEHKIFVDSNPYYLWFIIWVRENRVGTVYKTKLGEIGIFVKKEFQHMGVAKQVVPLLCFFGLERNIAYVSPLNNKSISLFSKLGFKLIGHIYELNQRESFIGLKQSK